MVRKAVAAAVLVCAAYLIVCIGALAAYRVMDPPFTTVQLQRRIEAVLSGSEYQPRQRFVPLGQIPVTLQRAVIAAEDGAFYDHRGIDWRELDKMINELPTGGRLRGASTISQQLVKNLFITTHSTPVRKGLEYILVPFEERLLDKNRILELYLNEVEWGPGVWGAAAAAEHHYGRPLSTITRDEAARLAACLPAPRSRRPQKMNEYSRIILQRMQSRGW